MDKGPVNVPELSTGVLKSEIQNGKMGIHVRIKYEEKHEKSTNKEENYLWKSKIAV